MGDVLDEQYLTTEEVAARYRTAPATVRHWRACGTGPRGYRVGKRVLYPASEVAAWDAKLRESSAR